MSAVRIPVGASMKTSPAAIFKPFAEAAAKAREQMQKEFDKLSLDKPMERMGKGLAKGSKEGLKSLAEIGKEAEKVSRKMESDFERAAKSFGRSAMQNFRGIVSAGARVGGGILRGAGIDFDVSSNVRNAVQAQSAVAMLSRKGYQEGAAGAAGVKQDPAILMQEVQKSALATAHSINATADAMTRFVENSGDLEMARAMMTDIGKIANATGADLDVLAGAAGKLDLSLATNDKSMSSKERKDIIGQTLRVFAAQGKTGALDIEPLAAQLPRMIAGASKLGMGRAEAFQTAGIMAQLNAAAGGKNSPAQAVGAINSLLDAMSKSQNGELGGGSKAAKKTGVHIPLYQDEGRTKLRNPLEIMAEAVVATKGNMTKLASLVPNVRGNATGTALANIYNTAGGGAKGEAAIKDAIETYKKAVMSAAEVEHQNAEKLQESAAKAQNFQTHLEMIAGTVANRVIPAFEQAVPTILKAVGAFGDLVGYLSNHPGQAIVLAIVGSIAKASIGSAVGTALSSLLRGAGGANVGGGKLGVAGQALAIAAAAFTVYSVGTMVIDAVGSMTNKAEENRLNAEVAVDNATRAARMAAKDPAHFAFTQANANELGSQRAALEERIKNAANPTNLASAVFGSLFGGKGLATRAGEKEDAAHLDELKNQLKQVVDAQNMMRTGVLKVHVINQPATPGGATTGPDAPHQ